MVRMLRRAIRNAHLWLPGYLRSRVGRHGEAPPGTLWITIADHFEPLWGKPRVALAAERVALWRREWPAIAARHQDSTGRPPQYCFFYAEEEYRPDLLEPLAEMTRLGMADVEVHLHHDNDTGPAFTEKVCRFAEAYIPVTGCCGSTTDGCLRIHPWQLGARQRPTRRTLVRGERRDLAPARPGLLCRLHDAGRARPLAGRPREHDLPGHGRPASGRAPTRPASR